MAKREPGIAVTLGLTILVVGVMGTAITLIVHGGVKFIASALGVHL